jgi:hypothetical protein
MPHIRTVAVVAALVVAGVIGAQEQTMQASEVIKKLGLTVTASKGQTAEKQAADEQACVSEAAEAANATAAGQAPPAEAKKKSVGRSAAGGAAAGALVGAISGNAGKGAAIGAAAGAGGSALKNKGAKKQAAEVDKATRDKIISAAKVDVTGCMSGKGYKVTAA